MSLLFNTVKYLKPIQVFYQLKYRLEKAGSLSSYNKTLFDGRVCFMSFKKRSPVHKAYLGNNKFTFLNLTVNFDSEINWNYQVHGKLWNYNLQYTNFLLQEEFSVEERKELLLSLYETLDEGKLALEPYPVSLRSINCIRFISQNKIEDKNIYSFLHAELDFLSKRPEYHLLGNHLLENAFALLMGGAFFSNQSWLRQGQKILEEQLEEQLLEDGSHFELSPMYHQIIFFRLLELIDWYSNWEYKDNSFLKFLMNKASKMYSWLTAISFESGAIPHFNDSANGIAYSTPWLLGYADKLGIDKIHIPLRASGYRSYKNESYECKVDAAEMGPSYQPGHAHADSLSFLLKIKDKAVFVEAGVSTYEANSIRQFERSTEAHNTVVVNNQNQSQVYGGFRVGNRAHTTILKDEPTRLIASHDGYKKALNLTHKRSFSFFSKSIFIIDKLDQEADACAYFHFHPGINIELQDNICFFGDSGRISFGKADVSIIKYNFALGYNKTALASALKVCFVNELKTEIKILD